MAYTTIDDPSAHFHMQLYTGNDANDRAITNDANAGDFQPDWLVVKDRDQTGRFHNFDSSRLDGSSESTLTVVWDINVYEHDKSARFKGLDSDGFEVTGSDVDTNDSNSAYITWQWKANGGSRTTNAEDGNNPAGGYQANTTAGFSIVDYTGTGAAGTMAHGLGAVPSLIMIKNRDEADDWAVYHSANTAAPETNYLVLNETDATADDATYWNDTAPTSSVFTINTAHNVNADAETYVAYCFAEIQGYSKFGGYTGNGSTDGPFIYTGFKPAWIMIKNLASGESWEMWDSARDPYNVLTKRLKADTNGAEVSSTFMDFVSNGVKHRNYSGGYNNSGESYIYMAFAEQPFVTSGGVPCTAR